MPDVLLFPSEPNPEDVTLREGGVAGPATYTVNVSATATGVATAARVPTFTRTVSTTATGVAAASTNLIPATPEPEPPPPAPSRGGGFIRPFPAPVTRRVKVHARAHGLAKVSLAVDHAGRRQQEDELLLVGAI